MDSEAIVQQEVTAVTIDNDPLLYYYDQLFTSLSHPKKKLFFFIRLKSKEKISAISE